MGVKDEQLDARKRKTQPKTGGEGGSTTRFTRHVEKRPDLTSVEASMIGLAVVRCVLAGDAIMFGMTQDGGAVSFTVLSGSDRTKDYAHSNEEIEYILQGIIDEYE